MLSFALPACGTDDGNSGEWDPQEPVPEVDAGEADVAPDVPEVLPEPEAPAEAASIETRASALEVRAGDEVTVACDLFDADGELLALEAFIAPEDLDILVTPTDVLGWKARFVYEARSVGTASVNCAADGLGLVDESPEVVTVLPGSPHTVVTRVSARSTVAGEPVGVTCEVFDAFGNVVPDASTKITTSPQGDGVTAEADQLTITRADIYTVGCQVDGAVVQDTQELEVTPALPANLAVAPVPNQPVYGLGQVITVDAVVTDIYDNVVTDAPLSFSSAPAGATFGTGRFRYDTEGRYLVTTRVDPPTHNDAPLEQTFEVVINGNGPDIDCVSPAHGTTTNDPQASQITFSGLLSDANGVSSVLVNGQPVTLKPNGGFDAPITVGYGMNFIEVVATDSLGEENSRVCAFLASERWVPENAFVDDSVTLRLDDDAFDDLNRADGLDSFTDILLTVLYSQGLKDTLSSALGPVNNTLYNECVQDSWFGCIIRVRIEYLDSDIGGPHDVRVDPINGGLNAFARVGHPRVRLFIDTTINLRGWIDIEYVEVDLDIDTYLDAAQTPRAALRRVNSVRSGNVDVDLDGFLGGLAGDIVQIFAQGTLKNLVQDQIRNFVDDQFTELIDGIVSGLDVSTLGTSFDVPRLDGSEDVTLSFGLRFTHLNSNPSRMLFGLGTRFTAPILRAGPTPGAPIPTGQIRLDPSTTEPIAAGVHVSLLNTALHTLWRAGFFDVTLDNTTLSGDLPQGTTVTLDTALPPLVVLDANKKVRLQIGAMRMSLVYPGLFDDPLELDLGAQAATNVQLNGSQLEFTGLVIERLFFSTPSVSLESDQRQILEGFLRNLVQGIADDTLNNALPALPIPSFNMPSSVQPFGLPFPSELGLSNPALKYSNTHFTLDGAFSIF